VVQFEVDLSVDLAEVPRAAGMKALKLRGRSD